VSIPGFPREYERTCADCGHAWRVPKWAVHVPRQAPPTGRQPTIRVNEIFDANAAMVEKAAVFRVCASCGSVHYKQRAIRWPSK